MLLAALTLLVAALHLVGLDWQLPHHPQGDEKILWLQVRIARGEEVSAAEELLARCYPSLLGKSADAVVPGASSDGTRDLDALRESSTSELLGIRLLVAILSAFIVPATWFLARRIVREQWAFLAAALASISTIAVWYSSMARPHAVVAVFTTATVAASLRARTSGRVSDFLLAGVFAALAVGTLHSGACACAAVAAAWWWNARPRFGAPLVGAILAAGLVFVSLFVFLRGKPLPDLTDGRQPGNALLSFFGMGVHNVDAGFFDGGGFLRFALAMRDYEPILATLAVIGLFVVVRAASRGRNDRARVAVFGTVAAQPLVHFVLFGLYSDSFQRFWFPVIPYLALLGVLGIGAITAVASARRRPLVRVLFAIPLLVQLGLAVKIVVLRVRDDTHELAASWIEAHPERAPFHVGPTVHLPLLSTDPGHRAEIPAQRMFFVPWTVTTMRVDPKTRARWGLDLRDPPVRLAKQRERLTQDSAAWLAELEPGVILLERFFDGRRMPFQVLREELLRRGEPIAVFDPIPFDAPAARPIDYMLDGPMAPEAWMAWSLVWNTRLGPEIEVFPTGN